MKIINNITEKLSDDLHAEISPHSKVSIAAACFSVYAYEELKEQLEQVDSLRFIFTSPTFLSEPSAKEKREFYIPRQAREKTLHGSEFEIRLRNEFTQKTISKKCADWVRRKAQFKSNCTDETMPGFLAVDSDHPVAYAPINGFTRADLGCERGGNMFSMIQQLDAPESKAYSSVNTHITKALEHYADRDNPDYENSIKESISAVEAMCCIITGLQGKTATLGNALGALEKSGVKIHGAMKGAFEKLYGYTSDENGIRHGGIDFVNAPAEDAKYMLIACSAFVNYLIEKHIKSGRVQTDRQTKI